MSIPQFLRTGSTDLEDAPLDFHALDGGRYWRFTRPDVRSPMLYIVRDSDIDVDLPENRMTRPWRNSDDNPE